METFNKIRKIILITSQVICAMTCVYLMYHVKSYEISWSFLATWMPATTAKINNLCTNFGTFVLALPLGLIISSMLMPQSITLKCLSGFFGVMGTLMTYISGLFRNTLTEVYDMRALIITKILSLKEKQEIFQSEYLIIRR